MRKTNKKAFLISNIKEIEDNNQSDLKEAVNFYIDKCKTQIIKLQNETFSQYDQLASLNFKLTSLETQIFDDETFLKFKNSEANIDLNDSTNQIEEKETQIRIDIRIAKDEIKKIKEIIINLKNSIINNETKIDELHFKIEAAKKYYKVKLEETNI